MTSINSLVNFMKSAATGVPPLVALEPQKEAEWSTQMQDVALVAADYGFICSPRFLSVCWCMVCVGTDGNCNFSAVRCPIGLKLGGDLELVSQISVHVLVSRFDCFLYCKQKKEQKNADIAKIAILEYLSFLNRAESY
jgi:hypothetical protein